MKQYLISLIIVFTLFLVRGYAKPPRESSAVIENMFVEFIFNKQNGSLQEIFNKLTGEKYLIQDDEFSIESDQFSLNSKTAALVSLKHNKLVLHSVYKKDFEIIEVIYKLSPRNKFIEKTIAISSDRGYLLKKVLISKPIFAAPNLKVVPYRYQHNVTYFGRTLKGGFYTGVEVPFDGSAVSGNQVMLGFFPNIKVNVGERYESESVYLGVYSRNYNDREQVGLPLQSESNAMVNLTSAVLGPRKHGLVPMACGWLSEMEHHTYTSEDQVRGEMKSLDFLAECGINWVSDSHPWGGETDKMNSLVQGDQYEQGQYVRKFLKHAENVGVHIVMWPTMNNTHPWWKEKGQAFRTDKPEWIMVPGGQPLKSQLTDEIEYSEKGVEGNCIANKPFLEWLKKINNEALDTGLYSGWAMDGDFFGGGGFVLPVNCPSSDHDHAAHDSNYASERALNELVKSVLKKVPNTYIWLLRPPMDLGIWSHRNADSSFTIDEFGGVKPLPGLSQQPINVAYGDKIRKWSRVRVHYHFFPHYLDQPQVFVAPKSWKPFGPPWPSEKIDYVMLSALSSSPNQLYYIPTKAGIPEKDKSEIRKWLDWGRKNIEYLNVRKDLPDWPQAGKVDGSAHIVQNHGLIFLFNPNRAEATGSFVLNKESIGLTQRMKYQVSQVYPNSDAKRNYAYEDKVMWAVPGESAVILQVSAH